MSLTEKEPTFGGPGIQSGITYSVLSYHVPSLPQSGIVPDLSFWVFYDLDIFEMHRPFIFQNVPQFGHHESSWLNSGDTFLAGIPQKIDGVSVLPTQEFEVFYSTWFINCTNTQVQTTRGTRMIWGSRQTSPMH